MYFNVFLAEQPLLLGDARIVAEQLASNEEGNLELDDAYITSGP
jgi:hypothetical protein